MSWGEALVVAIGVIATLVVVVWFFVVRKHPEHADSHATGRPFEDASGRGEQPGDVVERPAGPGAESQLVEEPGDMRPGPGPGPHRPT